MRTETNATSTKKGALCTRKRRLLDYFEQQGLPYTVTTIDREPVVYRKLKNHDIEISGGSYQRPFYVYVWELTSDGRPTHTVAAYTVLSGDIPSAAKEIDSIAEKYEEEHHGNFEL